jgi:hypothetical protein
MFWTIAISIVTVPFAYKLVERLFPNKIKTLAINYGWQFLEMCSKVELKAIDMYKKIKPYFPKKEEKSIITVVHDGDEINKYEFNDFIKNNINQGYDFVLYEIPLSDNNKYDKCILRYDNHKDIEEIVELNANNEVNFNVIQFNFKDVTEKIYNIKFDKTQYMVNNNILFDRKFLKWYMLKNHNLFVQDQDNYNITFIDHEMNYITLSENEYIVIKNNKYEISKTI